MLSFDLEDWFQVERLRSAIARNEWGNYEIRMTSTTEKLLDILRKHELKATFFVLGWIAEKVPGLIWKMKEDGHEIASHGYGHELLHELNKDEFEKDLLMSKYILKELTGEEILGYRAPSFTITSYVPEILERNGFKYDSSFFPCSFNLRYGKVEMKTITQDLSIGRLHNGLLEVPISTLRLFGREIPWGGGGYFRLYPYWLFKMGVKSFAKEKRGYVFYAHPWEMDPGQPRVENTTVLNRFFHYYGLSSTERKLENLLKDFNFVSIKEGLLKLGLL